MIRRRPNFDIVLSALRAGEDREYTIRFPNGLDYGWAEGRLCNVFGVWHSQPTDVEPDEIRWIECSDSFNYIVEQCEQMSDEEITGYVSTTVMMERNR
jgi:hypothetical protein